VQPLIILRNLASRLRLGNNNFLITKVALWLTLLLVGACQSKQNTEQNMEKANNQSVAEDTIHTEFYSNGNKKVVVNIEQGKYNGKYSFYSENGKLSEEGIMIMGLKNGIWKYYDKDNYLQKVLEYDNDKILFELDKADFSLLPHVIEKERIEINVPINWKTDTNYNLPILLSSKKKCDVSVVFCPNFTLTKEALQKDMTFDDYLKFSYKLMGQKISYFKAVTQGQLLINGLPAFQIAYLGLVNGVKLGGVTTWINKGNDVYIVTGLAINEKDSEFLKYKGLFQEVASSFREY
jgi:hypothetical protein